LYTRYNKVKEQMLLRFVGSKSRCYRHLCIKNAPECAIVGRKKTEKKLVRGSVRRELAVYV